jgi:small-conductance mechanosensitive channel
MENVVIFLNQHNVSVFAVVASIGLLISAFVLSYVLKRPVLKSIRQLAPRLGLPYEAVLITSRLLIGALWVVTGMLALEIWGVSVGGLWTLLVSAATIVGVGFLATWTMISNITASFFIAFWRPFHLGDTIEIIPDNCSGRVIDSNLMFVVVRENSGSVIRIPNNLFFQKMFRVTGSSNKTLFEEYEARTTSGPHARLDRPPV